MSRAGAAVREAPAIPEWRGALAGRSRAMRFGGRRSRRRANVHVTGGGCCLPMAVVLASGPVLAVRLLWKAAR